MHQRRLDILTRLSAGTLSPSQAAELLGVSVRQLRRVRASFAAEGAATLVHGNQGRTPSNQTAAEVRTQLRALAGPGGPYHDFNVCHLQEVLAERHELPLGRSTLDRLLKQEQLRQPRQRRTSRIYRRRTRRSAEGMLVQVDGSPHAWLEDRGPRLCLLGAIDDATGQALYAHFRPTEDQVGYLLLFRALCQTHGRPLGVYHDRHTILLSPKRPDLDDELAGTPPQSQIQRLLSELGIEGIPAHSPQAKGRIERLWGTFQDRLTKELRLAGITTPEAANAFLPAFLTRYNARFAHPAADPTPAWVPLPSNCDLAYYFTARENRRVRADHTIAWYGRAFQLQRDRGDASLAGQAVTVHVAPEGEIYVYAGTKRLAYVVVERLAGRSTTTSERPSKASAPPDPTALARRRAWLFGHHHSNPADNIAEQSAVIIAEQ
jgi:transposase